MGADPQGQKTDENIGKAEGLLRSLVPHAQCFCFYSLERDCVWSSDGADDYEIDQFVRDLPEGVIEELGDGVLHRTLSSARTVLALPVCGEEQDRLGMLVVLFPRNTGKSSWFNPSLLKSILEPALAVIGEGFYVGRKFEQADGRAAKIEKELKLVYRIDEKTHGAKARHLSLAQLVGQSGRFLGINYSVLQIPSKRIRITATHSSWKHVNRNVLNRFLVEQLMPKLEGRRIPVVFRIPAIEGSEDIPDSGCQALLSPLLDSQGNTEGVLAQLGRVDDSGFSRNDRRFMTHIVRKVEYVIEKSFDSMTGFMNRNGFEDQLKESLKALRSNSDAHQLIYFDLDNLQLVNDRFSRAAGDEVVTRFARLLEEDLPNTGALSRLAGNEFCMLLTHADATTALEHAQTIREKSGKLRYLEGDTSLQITMSIGISEFGRMSGSDGSALTTARMACESAKDHGGDRIEVYDHGSHSIIRRYDDMQLVAEIQKALDRDNFELRAQPIVSVVGEDARPIYEVLLRMLDVDGVGVSSKALFSAAERYRLMPQIDRWVVSNTLRKLGAIREFVRKQEAVFSINLSGQSLGDDEILEFIEDEIERSGVPASSLCFEITESAAVSRLHKAQEFIDRLRELGCSFSLDDFGAGLSSFAYLKNFKVDTLKIDGGFIVDIANNRISESMVAAITQVAKVMQLKTVAEYVETKDTHQKIATLGVSYAQGHYVGEPIALDDVLAGLADTPLSSTG